MLFADTRLVQPLNIIGQPLATAELVVGVNSGVFVSDVQPINIPLQQFIAIVVQADIIGGVVKDVHPLNI